MYKSVETLLPSKLTVRCKNSCVKFILGWYLLRSSRKNLSFSLPCVLSIYQYQTNSRYSCVLRKSVSNLSMKIQAYVGANLVPLAVPDICCLTIPFKIIVLQYKTSHFIKVFGIYRFITFLHKRSKMEV